VNWDSHKLKKILEVLFYHFLSSSISNAKIKVTISAFCFDWQWVWQNHDVLPWFCQKLVYVGIMVSMPESWLSTVIFQKLYSISFEKSPWFWHIHLDTKHRIKLWSFNKITVASWFFETLLDSKHSLYMFSFYMLKIVAFQNRGSDLPQRQSQEVLMHFVHRVRTQIHRIIDQLQSEVQS
jgi:hypothetical protein